jgi:hypothetical protein
VSEATGNEVTVSGHCEKGCQRAAHQLWHPRCPGLACLRANHQRDRNLPKAGCFPLAVLAGFGPKGLNSHGRQIGTGLIDGQVSQFVQ